MTVYIGFGTGVTARLSSEERGVPEPVPREC